MITGLPARQITIRARVTRYVQRALVQHFDGGRYEAFDATGLEILGPEERAGRELKIFHDRRPAADDVWRNVGSELTFSIDAHKLDDGTKVFKGALASLDPTVRACSATERRR